MAAVQTAGPVRRLTLERGTWYGLTMYPGYGDGPYHSPIRVDEIKPQGQRLFKLSFLNLGYAAGVQNFVKVLRTLRRAQSHLVAEETEVDDRTYVIMPLSRGWFSAQLPHLESATFFDQDGALIAASMVQLGR